MRKGRKSGVANAGGESVDIRDLKSDKVKEELDANLGDINFSQHQFDLDSAMLEKRLSKLLETKDNFMAQVNALGGRCKKIIAQRERDENNLKMREESLTKKQNKLEIDKNGLKVMQDKLEIDKKELKEMIGNEWELLRQEKLKIIEWTDRGLGSTPEEATVKQELDSLLEEKERLERFIAEKSNEFYTQKGRFSKELSDLEANRSKLELKNQEILQEIQKDKTELETIREELNQFKEIYNKKIGHISKKHEKILMDKPELLHEIRKELEIKLRDELEKEIREELETSKSGEEEENIKHMIQEEKIKELEKKRKELENEWSKLAARREILDNDEQELLILKSDIDNNYKTKKSKLKKLIKKYKQLKEDYQSLEIKDSDEGFGKPKRPDELKKKEKKLTKLHKELTQERERLRHKSDILKDLNEQINKEREKIEHEKSILKSEVRQKLISKYKRDLEPHIKAEVEGRLRKRFSKKMFEEGEVDDKEDIRFIIEHLEVEPSDLPSAWSQIYNEKEKLSNLIKEFSKMNGEVEYIDEENIKGRKEMEDLNDEK